MIDKLKRIYRKTFRNPPKAKVTYKTKVERHGSDYGGWNIIPNSLGSDSIVYSFGIGQDISFDISIIKKYACKIYGYDPTPRVIDWLKSEEVPDNFQFYPFALSHEDGTLTFYTPLNENNISHTAHKSVSSEAMDVPCHKLATIMKRNGHTNIDLLKMDIEGFEEDVLKNMIDEKIFPKQLLIEFHHFFPNKENVNTEQMIEFLALHGYDLFNVSDSFCEYSFVFNKKLN